MKLKSTLLIILTALSLSAFSQQKPRVAVYVTGDNPINEIVGSSLEDGLAHDGKYTAVERTASFLRELSKEHDYQRSGEVDESQIADLGKQFGVEYVCVTTVTDVWGSELYISARIIDVESAEVIATSSSSCSQSSSSNLVKALDKLSKDLLGAMNISKSTKTSKVAIYVTKTGNKDVDVILGDQLVAGFASSGKYLAIERTSRFLSQIKKEQGYQQSGAVDDDELTKLGQKFGVQYVCVAKTTKWGGDYFISARLIDVKTGEIINSNNAQGKKLNNSQNVVDVATEIAQRLSGRTIEEDAEYNRVKNGELILPEGKYVGNIAREQPNGSGKLYYSENHKEKIYNGEWVDGKMMGHGTIIFRSGKTYEGDIDNGLMHGNGVIYYSNGKKYYEGKFVYGKKDGTGIWYDQEGRIVYRGDFKNNKMHGKGTFFTDSGIKYEGDFFEDEINGYGILYKSDRVIYKGEFKNGKKNGKGKSYNDNGNLEYSGDFVDNEKSGWGTDYWENGKIAYEGGWKNGKRNGSSCKVYDEDGTLRYKGEIVNDNIRGCYGIAYDKNGKVKYSGKF